MTFNTDSTMPIRDLSLKDISILVVEDVDATRRFMSMFLTRRGATVYFAENGQEGLNLFKGHQVDVVLTDIQMPVMDGLEMASAIREFDDETPIIFLSAHTEVELLQRSIRLAASEYLIKPISNDKLLSALSVVIDKLHNRQKLRTHLDYLGATLSHLQDEKQRLKRTITQMIGNDQHSDVSVLTQSKYAISGDIYCIGAYQDSLYVLLIDGMGHGVSAILPALDLPKHFRKLASQGAGLCHIADELNQLVFEDGLTGYFVAATLVRVDSGQRLVEVINCGNPSVLMVDRQGKPQCDFPSKNLALGIVGASDFIPELQDYRYSDSFELYLFSDGFTDTLQYLKNEPGVEVFLDMMANNPAGIMDELHAWLQTISSDQRQDDITLLKVRGLLLPQIPLTDDASVASLTQNLSVLFVAQDCSAREYLYQLLKEQVGTLYSAFNGQDGLRLFKQYRPQLVIAGVTLSVMDGLEMVEHIRAMVPDVQIILISDINSWRYQENKLLTVLKLAGNKFLDKPLSSDKLLDAIQYCLDNYQYINDLRMSASVFMTTPLAMTITDADCNIVTVNPAFTAITGYDMEEIKGLNPKILSSGKHNAEFFRQMWECINNTGQWSGEIWNRRKNGELFLEWITIAAIRNQEGDVANYVSVFSKSTQRNFAKEKLHHLTQAAALEVC